MEKAEQGAKHEKKEQDTQKKTQKKAEKNRGEPSAQKKWPSREAEAQNAEGTGEEKRNQTRTRKKENP
jgi:hypothetical protein